MFECLVSLQPWAKGETTDDGSSNHHFLPHPHSHRLAIPRLKQKASVLHLWLIIGPIARLHAQERERLVEEEVAGLLAALLTLPPTSNGYRRGGRFLTERSRGFILYTIIHQQSIMSTHSPTKGKRLEERRQCDYVRGIRARQRCWAMEREQRTTLQHRQAREAG